MIIPSSVSIPFAIVALAACLFYAINAYSIFGATRPAETVGKIHQFWFNFLGSAIGWAALWLVVRKLWHSFSLGTPGNFTAGNAALLALAYVGVTGHLPYATAGALQGLKDLAGKIAGAMK